MTKLWNSIKRNPVINAFILAAICQVVNDYLNNEIGWDNLGVYIGTVCIGVIARMFTVPEVEHAAKMVALKQKNSDLARTIIDQAKGEQL